MMTQLDRTRIGIAAMQLSDRELHQRIVFSQKMIKVL